MTPIRRGRGFHILVLLTIVAPVEQRTSSSTETGTKLDGNATTLSGSDGTTPDKNNTGNATTLGSSDGSVKYENNTGNATTLSGSDGTTQDENSTGNATSLSGSDGTTTDKNNTGNATTLGSSDGTTPDKNNYGNATTLGSSDGTTQDENSTSNATSLSGSDGTSTDKNNTGNATTLGSSDGTTPDKNNYGNATTLGGSNGTTPDKNSTSNETTLGGSDGTTTDKNNTGNATTLGGSDGTTQDKNNTGNATTLGSSDGTTPDKNNTGNATTIGSSDGSVPNEDSTSNATTPIGGSDGTTPDKKNTSYETTLGGSDGTTTDRNNTGNATTLGGSDGTTPDKNSTSNETTLGGSDGTTPEKKPTGNATTLGSSDGTTPDKNNTGNATTIGSSDGSVPNENRTGNATTLGGSDGTTPDKNNSGNATTLDGSDGITPDINNTGNATTLGSSDGTTTDKNNYGNATTLGGSDGTTPDENSTVTANTENMKDEKAKDGQTTFKLYQPEATSLNWTDGGYPMFAYLTIDSIPSTRVVYKILLKSWIEDPISQYPPMSILTANGITLGSNIENYRHTHVTTRLSSSLKDTKLNDEGRITITLYAYAGHDKETGNVCKIEIVLIRPNISKTYRLRAEVNDLGYQEIVIRGRSSLDHVYKDWIASSHIRSSCPTETYYASMTSSFRIVVITNPNTTTGPLQIFLPTSSWHIFNYAKIESRGRNVVCVNRGYLISEQTKGSINGKVLNLPFVCNRKRYDEPIDNMLTIYVHVKIVDAILSSATGDNTPAFSATLSNLSQQKQLSHAIRIVASRNLGLVTDVKKIRLNNTPEDSEKYKNGQKVSKRWLEISVDGNMYIGSSIIFEAIQEGHSSDTIQWTSSPEGPVVGRYIRIGYHSHRDACHVNFTVTTTNDSMPFWRGPRPQLNNLLNVLNANGAWNSQLVGGPRCYGFDVPHMWVEFNTSLFDIDVSRPFTVAVRGYKLNCNSTIGPRIIMVAFPKHFGPEVENHHHLCDYVYDEVNGLGQSKCHYYCDCRGRAECHQFTLLLMYVDDKASEKQKNTSQKWCLYGLRVIQNSE